MTDNKITYICYIIVFKSWYFELLHNTMLNIRLMKCRQLHLKLGVISHIDFCIKSIGTAVDIRLLSALACAYITK